MMTPAQARELNSFALSLYGICRMYGAAEGITAAAFDLHRMTSEAALGLASVQATKEQA